MMRRAEGEGIKASEERTDGWGIGRLRSVKRPISPREGPGVDGPANHGLPSSLGVCEEEWHSPTEQ